MKRTRSYAERSQSTVASAKVASTTDDDGPRRRIPIASTTSPDALAPASEIAAAAAIDDRKRPAFDVTMTMKRTNTSTTAPLDNTVCLQTPHTLRLLKLIRDGTTPDVTSTAIALLDHTAAHPSYTPAHLWDLLGRLQAYLVAPEWPTRQAAAAALTVIAQRLPTEDQVQFLTRASVWADADNDTTAMDGIDSDVQCRTNDSSEKDDTDDNRRNSKCSNTKCDTNKKALSLTVGALRHEQLTAVLAAGVQLYATAESRYDVASQRNEFDDDDNDNSYSNDDSSSDCVARRLRRQRGVLAQRLGLGTVSDVLGTQSSLLDDTITNEDLQGVLVEEKKKHDDSIQDDDTGPAAAASSTPLDTSMRALLVRHVVSQCIDDNSSSATVSRHRRPQALLATELIYRMFDPVWYIRHGALLGVLAVLRAWNRNRRGFGAWPQDILSRCLCVLALDRFGDFAGGSFVGNATTSAAPSLSVVAPCREVAGQVVSVLVAMAPPEVRDDALAILARLAEHEGGAWEIRHGALSAWKYVAVVEATGLLRKTDDSEVVSLSNKTHDPDLQHRLGIIATAHLIDESDDVKSVAAQILTELAVAPVMDLVWMAVPQLWRALTQHVRTVSSCTVDLVSLLATLVRADGSLFLSHMNDSDDETDLPRICQVSQVLQRLLDSDFQSVRLSALSSIGILVSDKLSFVSSADSSQQDDESLRMAYRKLVERVFETFFDPLWTTTTLEDSKNRGRSPSHTVQLDAWHQISGPCDRILPQGHRSRLEFALLCRYFGIHRPRSMETKDELETATAASALADFFGQPSIHHHDRVSRIVETCLLTGFQSPWTSQCEATSLLYQHIMSRTLGDESTRQSLNIGVDQDGILLCLSTVSDNEKPCLESIVLNECDTYFERLITDRIDEAYVPTELATEIIDSWTATMTANGYSFSTGPQSLSVLSAMRVRATLAGAILATGVPEVITPLVRTLMTSFNNETVSKTRLQQTCSSLTALVAMIRKDSKYSKAEKKIVNSLCRAALTPDTANQDSVQKRSAVLALQDIVRNIPYNETLNNIPAISSRLEGLSSYSECPDAIDMQSLLDCLRLLLVLSKGFQAVCSNELVSSVIHNYAKSTIELASNDERVEIRLASVAVLKSLCVCSSKQLLDQAIPEMLTILRNDNASRLNTCLLLKSIIEAAGTAVAPFVRALLPVVLSLVTNQNPDCAQTANSVFAMIVRVAPLVRESSSYMVDSSSGQSESVIDHLIFGKPLPDCDFPDDLKACLKSKGITLRGYQREGISWLRFLQRVNLCGALCDDMGIGKTVQALVSVALAHSDSTNPNNERSLIICPATLIEHWKAEIEKYFGDTMFYTLCLLGNQSKRDSIWTKHSSSANIVVASYSTLRSDTYLGSVEWSYCILDEGHLLKNPKTATAKASRRIRSKHRLILTGTPIQNRVHELWATFDFLMPNFLGDSETFSTKFANPIALSQLPTANAVHIANGLTKLKILHQQVLPFILRREKDQVLSELPAKTHTVIRVPMSTVQKDIYLDFCSGHDIASSLAALHSDIETSCENTARKKKRQNGDMLKSLVFLRLLCTHPSLVLSRSQKETIPTSWMSIAASGKMVALAEILREAGIHCDKLTGADNDSSLVYCDEDIETQDEYSASIEAPDELGGLISSPLFDSGTKKSKCLIFAQFTKSLDAVETILFRGTMPSLKYVRLDGTVPLKRRTQIVDSFCQDPNIAVMLLTTRVGGLGLNLTAADTVVFLESDYNPFADLQAMDRARRIGQTKVVNVYRLVTQDSVEEEIMLLQEKKMALSDSIVNTENSSMYSMGTDRLLDIFTLRNNYEAAIGGAPIKLEYDLEGLVDECAKDYASLSTQEFTDNLIELKSIVSSLESQTTPT